MYVCILYVYIYVYAEIVLIFMGEGEGIYRRYIRAPSFKGPTRDEIYTMPDAALLDLELPEFMKAFEDSLASAPDFLGFGRVSHIVAHKHCPIAAGVAHKHCPIAAGVALKHCPMLTHPRSIARRY
jgi:hypothetical protein